MGTSLAGATLASHHRRGRISPAVQEQIFGHAAPGGITDNADNPDLMSEQAPR
jgi:hypothetical protein